EDARGAAGVVIGSVVDLAEVLDRDLPVPAADVIVVCADGDGFRGGLWVGAPDAADHVPEDAIPGRRVETDPQAFQRHAPRRFRLLDLAREGLKVLPALPEQ